MSEPDYRHTRSSSTTTQPGSHGVNSRHLSIPGLSVRPFRYLPLTVRFSDLGLLRRDKALQLRYNAWTEEIKERWGTLGPHLHPLSLLLHILTLKPTFSEENYLLKHRLRWGQPDRLSILKPFKGIDEIPMLDDSDSLPIPSVDYFRADTPSLLISIITNDWPYSGTSSPSRP
jgi:hypothetical protein